MLIGLTILVAILYHLSNLVERINLSGSILLDNRSHRHTNDYEKPSKSSIWSKGGHDQKTASFVNNDHAYGGLDIPSPLPCTTVFLILINAKFSPLFYINPHF